MITTKEKENEMIRLEKIHNRNEAMIPVITFLLKNQLIKSHLDIIDKSKTGMAAVMEITRNPIPQHLLDIDPNLANLPSTFKIELLNENVIPDIYAGWTEVLSRFMTRSSEDQLAYLAAIEEYRNSFNMDLDKRKVELENKQ